MRKKAGKRVSGKVQRSMVIEMVERMIIQMAKTKGWTTAHRLVTRTRDFG